ncbi:accessory Sec system translocase SecA2 [Brevibacterium salitolerans]|uniref:accessory Sec system translocase SecA2 n=1 Tax=Brevibacterium salitolerans TaxID=1403566 RepID=UPI0031DB2D04
MDRRWWRRPDAWVRRLRQEPGTADLARYEPLVEEILAQRAAMRSRGDADLAQSASRALAAGLSNDGALVRFLACAGEMSRRRLDMEPFACQLLAAVSMLRGHVVDMATGEGKTLVGFLVAAGLAGASRRVHVLSANDYLAGRDAAAGGPLFSALGLSCSAVVDGMEATARAEAHRSDIVYATVHQIGFDLLRDRQRAPGVSPLVPEQDAVVVDEIDAVLLDDAMVPLVLAGDAEPAPEGARVTELVGGFAEGEEYEVDGDRRSASFTAAGIARLEDSLCIDNLYAPEHVDLLAAAHVALHAHALVTRDVDYVVAEGRVRLVDDARGRVAARRRWPDGLQEAVERKEGLEVTGQAEILDQMLVETVARGYRTITGMSGTAAEAAERLEEDLGLTTGAVPTGRPCTRRDEPDRLHLTAAQRDAAAAGAVRDAHAAGQPVLIGTGSVAESERFARRLASAGVHAQVLNAKNDAEEAKVIAGAGRAGAVTVSTQMAGRGVDIRLGPGAAEAGGLLVLGLGRYDSARLDRQLRGRAGRQGDPGRSVFFTSLEDDVVTEQLRIRRPPRSPDPDGAVRSPRFTALYAHAQRVAEGRLLQLHRTTRRYHLSTDRHRRALLEVRERLLAESEALDECLHRVWPDAPELREAWNAPGVRRLALEVVLFHMDRAWMEHLGRMAAEREGIHLRVLGRQNPLDEFTALAARDFQGIRAEVEEAVRRILEEAPEDAAGLADLGLRRPSSTWTYMVTDNPFGSEADRVVEFLGRAVRGGGPPAVTYV